MGTQWSVEEVQMKNPWSPRTLGIEDTTQEILIELPFPAPPPERSKSIIFIILKPEQVI